MHYIIRKANPFDALHMASRLRMEDAREIRSASGRDPKDLLPECVRTGKTSFVLEVAIEQGAPGRLLALFGVSAHPIIKTLGVPWMVATPLLEHHQMFFLRNCRKWIDNLSEGFDTLINCVDARNEVHIKWLKWCGFTFTHLHTQWGHDSLPFWEFEKQTNV